MTNEQLIENVKLIKGIHDDLQDDLLLILLTESEARILAYINQKRAPKLSHLPTELAYIVQDVTVIRFNRLNAEGTQSDSEEGRQQTWQNHYLADHLDVLDSYHDPKVDPNADKSRRGTLYSF